MFSIGIEHTNGYYEEYNINDAAIVEENNHKFLAINVLLYLDEIKDIRLPYQDPKYFNKQDLKILDRLKDYFGEHLPDYQKH